MAVAQTLLGCALLFLVTRALYRLYLHPLRRFPGAPLAAISTLYEFYHDFLKPPGGTFFQEINRMHDKYGPIVRIGPDELHVRDPEWLDVLYVGTSQGIRDKQPLMAQVAGTPLGVFGTVEHHKHRLRRTAINGIFSKRAVYGCEPMLQQKTRQLVAFVEQQLQAGPLEAKAAFLAYVTDALCAHSFDITFDLMDSLSDAQEWHHNVMAIVTLTPVAKMMPWATPLAMQLPLSWLRVLTPKMARIAWAHKFIHQKAEEMIARHGIEPRPTGEAMTDNDFDIFRSILTSDLPPEDKQRDRIAQEALTILFAGGETVSRHMAHALLFIFSERDRILEPLRRELDGLFPDRDAQLDLRTLEQAPWLTAIIKETLRLTGVFTNRSPLTPRDKTLLYGQYSVPPGTYVGMTYRDVLLDPGIFEQPLEFRPERWTDRNPHLKKNERFFVPFARGSRNCIGMNLAWGLLYIGIATMVHRLDLSVYETSRQRDFDCFHGAFTAEPSPASKGIRFTGQRRL